jgi:hypothetical protein
MAKSTHEHELIGKHGHGHGNGHPNEHCTKTNNIESVRILYIKKWTSHESFPPGFFIEISVCERFHRER